MKYYKTDSRKISYREYWHLSRKGFWLAWLNKLRGKRMNFIRGIPGPQPLADRLVEPDAMPREILERLAPAVLDLEKLGFNQSWYYTNPQSLTEGVGYGVIGLHSSRCILSKAIYVSYKSRERFIIALVSGFADGTILGTTNKKRDFNSPPRHVVQRRVGADAECLFNLHQKKLARMGRGNRPEMLNGQVEVAAFEDRFMQQSYADKIKRGIWVEMAEAEVTALRAQRGVPPPVPQTQTRAG